ncbi:MAG: hypothetical protein ABI920_02325 [Casimicrobiaceae bacterium]
MERASAPVAVLGPWSRAVMLVAGAGVVGLGLAAEPLLGILRGAPLLP